MTDGKKKNILVNEVCVYVRGGTEKNEREMLLELKSPLPNWVLTGSHVITITEA